MLLLISDASVLIDIENGGLTSAMFTLPYQFAVPDILFADELMERHAALTQLGLVCKTMSGELIAEAYELRQKYPRPSNPIIQSGEALKNQGRELLFFGLVLAKWVAYSSLKNFGISVISPGV